MRSNRNIAPRPLAALEGEPAVAMGWATAQRADDLARAENLPAAHGFAALRAKRTAICRRLVAAIALAIACGSVFAATACAEPPLPIVESSSRSGDLQATIRSIPFDKLTPDAQQKVRGALANVTVYRRMPDHVIECDPALYYFLVRHPDVVVNIWQTLRLSQLDLKQTGPDTFQATETDGTTCSIEFLYRSHDLHIVLAEGTYSGPLARRAVRGICLLVLRTGCVQETDGRYYVTSRLDAVLNVEPGAVELVTKTLQPILGKIAENNFYQSVAFLGSLSKTAEANSEGVARLATKLEHVQPENRAELAKLARQIGRQAEARQEAAIINDPAVRQAAASQSAGAATTRR